MRHSDNRFEVTAHCRIGGGSVLKQKLFTLEQ